MQQPHENPQKNQSEEAEPSWSLSFTDVYYAMRQRLGLLILCALAGLLLGVAYFVHAPKLFAARTVIQVDTVQRKVVNFQEVNSEDLASIDILKTIEKNLASRTLLALVVAKLELTPERLDLHIRQDNEVDKKMVDVLQKRVGVKLVRGTRLINIDAKATHATLAKELCDTVVHEYMQTANRQNVDIVHNASTFLLDEAERLKVRLEKSEQALQNYKEQNKSVSLDNSQNIVVEDLKMLDDKLSAAKAERLKLESDYAQVQKLGTTQPAQLLTITSVANNLAVLDQMKNLTQQQANLAFLAQRYKPKHPKYAQAASQLQELQNGLDRAVIKVADSLRISLDAARGTETRFEEALKEQESRALDLNKLAIPYNVLSREVDSDRALYASVMTRLKETDVTKGIAPIDFRVVEPAVVPTRWTEPNPVVVGAGSTFAGLAFGMFLILVLSVRDSSLKTVDQAESVLSLPALGAVPKAEQKPNEKDILILREPHGAVAEAFRTLRTGLSLLGGDAEKRVFLFTSAVPGEGKSFCSINYAISLAQQGMRTLLIDADLRLPTIAKKLFDVKPHPGVSDVIAKHLRLEECARAHDVENLDVLTAGTRAPNPAELLSGKGFSELIRDALLRYDRVVVDSAPVNAVADSLLLVKCVHAVCLVVHAAETPRRAVLRACLKLTEAGRPPAGFILNRLPLHSGVNYYYYYSAGEYGKGVYGAPVGDNG